MKIEIKEILNADTVRITTTDERWYLHPENKEWIPSSTWITVYVPSPQLAVWMAKKGWDEAELIKHLRGAHGSRVHKGCEVLASGGEVNHNDSYADGNGEIKELTREEYEGIMSFEQWCNEYNPKFLSNEKTVFNKKLKYAGTLDALCEIKGVIWLIDYKTSANIYLSHKAQISSYFHADGIKADKMAILQLGYNKNKYKKYKFTEIEDKFDSFVAAQHFWREENENKKPFQKDYPRKLKLKE